MKKNKGQILSRRRWSYNEIEKKDNPQKIFLMPWNSYNS